MQHASLEYRALRDQLQRDIAAHIGAVARRLREPSADNQRAAERSFEQLGTTFEAGELAFEQLDGPQPTIHTAPADPVTPQVSEQRQRRWGAGPDQLEQWSHVLNQAQASPNPPPAAP